MLIVKKNKNIHKGLLLYTIYLLRAFTISRFIGAKNYSSVTKIINKTAGI